MNFKLRSAVRMNTFILGVKYIYHIRVDAKLIPQN